jgi:uncharacterized protein
LRIEIVIWDQTNTEHIARHDVSRQEIEDVLLGEIKPTYFATIQDNRLLALGTTEVGRQLLVVLASVGKYKIYPITGRDMTDKERRRYKKWLIKKGKYK